MAGADRWRARYEAFVSKKVDEANAAHLPPYVTAVDHGPEGAIAIGNAWSLRLFDGPFYISGPHDPRRPSCSLVFVQSADGNTVAPDPASLGGGDTDKHLIYEGLSRVAADAVLAGAGTVRGGHLIFSVWHRALVELRQSFGLARHPRQVVATLRGLDVDGMLLFNVPEIPVIVLTIASAADTMRTALAARPWVTPVVMESRTELGSAFQHLRSMGMQRVSCVGGRQLAGQLLDARLVDDVYLTTSPTPGGEPDTPLYRAPLPGRVVLRKHGTAAESGVVFEHWRLW